MTKKEIEQINAAAKGGDVETAAAAFLGLGPKDNRFGYEASINGIVDEVTQWNEADAETRDGIDAYKAAKDTAEPSPPKTAGKTTAKPKK